ncbi:hypothetical protein BJV78DRAFT_1281707 [Lactifluus subvellereus]|nr:hypothetical protein BJV78DRAFT_1281707 [Lactifluus subvellereus]
MRYQNVGMKILRKIAYISLWGFRKRMALPTTRMVSASYVSLLQLSMSDEHEDNRVLDSDHHDLKEYEGIFIKVKTLGVFKSSDIQLNDVKRARSVPDFVSKFEGKLDSKPGLAHNAQIEFGCIRDSLSQAAYLGPREDSTTEDESYEKEQSWRYAERLELMHIADIASEK